MKRPRKMATRQLRQPRRTLPWLIAVLISSSLFSALASPYERNHLDGASRPLESIGRDRYGLLTAAWSRFPSNFWPNMFGERNDFAYFAGRSDRLFALVDKGNGATLRCYTLSKGTAKQEWAEPLSQKQGLRSSKGTLETYVIAEGYHIPTPGRASKADLARREANRSLQVRTAERRRTVLFLHRRPKRRRGHSADARPRMARVARPTSDRPSGTSLGQDPPRSQENQSRQIKGAISVAEATAAPTTMAYDKENRMSLNQTGSSSASYTYAEGGMGKMRSQIVDGVAATLIWDREKYLGMKE